MALKKNVLIQFIKDSRDNLISKLNEEQWKDLKQYIEERLLNLGISKEIDKAHNLIIEISKIHNNILSIMEDNNIRKYPWSNPFSRLNNLANNYKESMITDVMDFSQDTNYHKIEECYDKQKMAIREEYQNLISVCLNMPSGKKIQEYLEGLGFDLTALKKKEEEPVELVKPLNLDVLNLNKVNELNNSGELSNEQR